MVRDVAVMLGVPAARVVVTDDPARRHGGHALHLITVHDPDDPATTYRFLPEAGLGGLYLLLDECPACTVPSVPMATVSGLADLGRYLAATRPVPPGEATPTTRATVRTCWRTSSVTPGHSTDCEIGRSRWWMNARTDHASTRTG